MAANTNPAPVADKAEAKTKAKVERFPLAGSVSKEAFDAFEDYMWSNRLKKSDALSALILKATEAPAEGK